MSDISQLNRLEITSTSLLTWYAKAGRVEFTGPNIFRWLAKTTNFLCSEFGEDSQAQIIIDVPTSWRQLFWILGSHLAGAQPELALDELPTAALLVTSQAEVATRALEEQVGLPVLLQDMGPLSLRWMGAPVAGAADATAEINSQPDGFVYPVSEGFQLPAAALPEGDAPLILVSNETNYVELIWAAWAQGRRCVWVEPGLDVEAISTQELG